MATSKPIEAIKTAKTAAKATPPEPAEKRDTKNMNLAQKFVELRKACPEIIKKKHSDGVKYSFAKIFDVYELLAPAMNEWGVDWDIIEETATRHYENGDAMFYTCYTQNTRNGQRTVWVYEADITLQWINVDNPEETQVITLHALGTNDSGPDKAKGSAWTYCLKYYLFEKFNIDQGEDDPDMKDLSGTTPDNQKQGTAPQNNARGKTTPPNNKNVGNVQKSLSDKQLERMYRKGEDAGLTNEQINERILKKYGHKEPAQMTREQYDETCAALDNIKSQNQGGPNNAQ